MSLRSQLCVFALAVIANNAFAQAWPSKQITIVVPFAPGEISILWAGQ